MDSKAIDGAKSDIHLEPGDDLRVKPVSRRITAADLFADLEDRTLADNLADLQFRARSEGWRAAVGQVRCLVIVELGEDVGFVALADTPSERRILDIALVPEARGRGVGRAVLAEMVAGAIEQDRLVSLHVDPANTGALGLYASLGFAEVARSETHVRLEATSLGGRHVHHDRRTVPDPVPLDPLPPDPEPAGRPAAAPVAPAAPFDRDDLARATAVLLDVEAWPIDQLEAARHLHQGLCAAAGLDPDAPSPAEQHQTILEQGKAISPVDAASCAREYARTSAFLRGLLAAVEARHAEHPDRPVRVLYAGCGPLATLALPLTTVLAPDVVQFTLVDIHATSLDLAARAIAALGATDWFTDAVEADATTLQLDDHGHDILLSETMLRGLETEPQVAIAWNLLAQLPADALLVPASVELEVVLGDLVPRADGSPPVTEPVTLGSGFRCDAAAIRTWGPPARRGTVPGTTTLEVPRDAEANEDLWTTTTIVVHGDVVLVPRTCSLTEHVLTARPVDAPLRAGLVLEASYRLTPPGLVTEALGRD